MIESIKKNIGLTPAFLSRKKKKNFSIKRFVLWAFRNYGKTVDVEYIPAKRRYKAVR